MNRCSVTVSYGSTGAKPPVYFKAGDRSVCSYESIGTLANPVVGPTP